MTDQDLEAIRAGSNAATPPPWSDRINGVLPADADFISHAREDIPALLAEVQRLKAVALAAEARIRTEERERAAKLAEEMQNYPPGDCSPSIAAAIRGQP